VGAGVCAVIYSFVVLFGEIKEGDANRRVYVNGNRVTSEGDFQDTLAEMIGNVDAGQFVHEQIQEACALQRRN
jgi:hypothetical protein